MGHRREPPRLLHDSRARPLLVRFGAAHELERDLPIEPGISRLVDHAHPPLAEQLPDMEWPHTRGAGPIKFASYMIQGEVYEGGRRVAPRIIAGLRVQLNGLLTVERSVLGLGVLGLHLDTSGGLQS